MIDPSARVHPSADVEADVSIGANSAVWHRAQLRSGSRIGADCVVGRDAFIDEGVILGDRVKVQNAALVYHGVTVEDGVFIGPGAILTNDRFPRAITAAGDVARAGDWTISPIVLRTGCSIGAGAVVIAGSTVGQFATVGAGAVVTRDVPAHALVAGNPAKAIGWVCVCGQRLQDRTRVPAAAGPSASGSELHCQACGRVYAFATDGASIAERTASRQEVGA